MTPASENSSGAGVLLLGQRGQVPVSQRQHVWLLCQKKGNLKS